MKFFNLAQKHNLPLTESSHEIITNFERTGQLKREDLDKLIQDANYKRAKQISRDRITLPYGEDDHGKYVLYDNRRVYLETNKE